MEQTAQTPGTQQGRQQPVYDTRNGGHYGASAAVWSPSEAYEYAYVLKANMLYTSSFLRKAMRQLPSSIPGHGRM
ncbi:uncharacterized protein AKAW2_60689A [Aspergillus luchuensis]|uniref:Uncharacterized protein n=1 Tax=Aspergillus kawachii TaxID=1069201 RepID=A0A7R8A2V4_ASPKA|nr:uncharacterized protein AKAW2_60689A [Aspergillus luchuensis]BCS02425.1 hypothetical protein AKAW2_60689A [Aspergillus luchuensis]